MNGKRARQIRKALGYKKTPDQIVDRGGFREKEGRLMFGFIRNPEANRYRWWKRGVARGSLPLGIVARLAYQQESRRESDQSDLNNGEGNE